MISENKRVYNREYLRKLRLMEPEKIRERVRISRAKHPETGGYAYIKLWRTLHPEETRDMNALRRARKSNAFVERVYRKVVFERDQGICGICQEEVDPQDWHLDHIQSLSKGGEHSYSNTQVSHPLCNEKKGATCMPPNII